MGVNSLSSNTIFLENKCTCCTHMFALANQKCPLMVNHEIQYKYKTSYTGVEFSTALVVIVLLLNYTLQALSSRWNVSYHIMQDFLIINGTLA